MTSRTDGWGAIGSATVSVAVDPAAFAFAKMIGPLAWYVAQFISMLNLHPLLDRPSTLLRRGEFTSNPPEQHKNDNDDQDHADDPDTAVSIAITVAAEAAAEAAKQENDEDDDEDEPKRHGLISNLSCSLESKAKLASVQYCSYRAGCGSPYSRAGMPFLSPDSAPNPLVGALSF
jgi:hypothetical protein